MFKVRTCAPAAALVVLAAAHAAPPAAAQADVTVYEGARLIVGDGSDPIEDAAFVVRGARFEAVGRAGEVAVPAGAARVDLGGHTVIPALVDTHVHLSREREPLVEDLRRKAYYGVSVAMSLGWDAPGAPFEVRAETIPGAARLRTAGRGITRPEPGRPPHPTPAAADRASGRPSALNPVLRSSTLPKGCCP